MATGMLNVAICGLYYSRFFPWKFPLDARKCDVIRKTMRININLPKTIQKTIEPK